MHYVCRRASLLCLKGASCNPKCLCCSATQHLWVAKSPSRAMTRKRTTLAVAPSCSQRAYAQHSTVSEATPTHYSSTMLRARSHSTPSSTPSRPRHAHTLNLTRFQALPQCNVSECGHLPNQHKARVLTSTAGYSVCDDCEHLSRWGRALDFSSDLPRRFTLSFPPATASMTTANTCHGNVRLNPPLPIS